MTNPHPMSEAFKEAFRCHPAGVAILTANVGGRPVAMTVSSLISVNANPPTVAFSLSSRSSSTAGMLEAGSLVIHLPRYNDLALAQLGATSGADRFGPDVAWETLSTGEPRYTSVPNWFRARIIGTLPMEGATLVAAELIEGNIVPALEAEAEPLIYMDRRWRRLRDELDEKF